MAGFGPCDIRALPHVNQRAHGGEGALSFARVLTSPDVDGPLNFVDHAILPPGVSIGRHTHAADEAVRHLRPLLLHDPPEPRWW